MDHTRLVVERRGCGPLGACLRCGSTRISAVFDLDVTNFLCESCQACWHVESARVWRVDPRTCITCRHREDCLAATPDHHATAA
jgi:hypothetical protein